MKTLEIGGRRYPIDVVITAILEGFYTDRGVARGDSYGAVSLGDYRCDARSMGYADRVRLQMIEKDKQRWKRT